MNKIIMFLMPLVLFSCNAAPEIVNKNNPKGYIITDKNPTVSELPTEPLQVTQQSLDISWWWIIWLVCLAALIIYIIKFIKLFKK